MGRLVFQSEVLIAITCIVIFFIFQMTLPFPIGLLTAIVVILIIIAKFLHKRKTSRYALINYRRKDPQTLSEKLQNKHVRDELEKKFLLGKISEEEYKRHLREFEKNE